MQAAQVCLCQMLLHGVAPSPAARLRGAAPQLAQQAALASLCPAGEGEVSNSWLTEVMSVPASLCHCPPRSAGEGREKGRYQLCCWGMQSLCCWGMQFPHSSCTYQAQIISAFIFNEELMSRGSSGKPNLASSPCRYGQKQLYRHASI